MRLLIPFVALIGMQTQAVAQAGPPARYHPETVEKVLADRDQNRYTMGSWIEHKRSVPDGQWIVRTKHRDYGSRDVLRAEMLVDCKAREVRVLKSGVQDVGTVIDIVNDPPRSEMDEHLLWRKVCHVDFRHLR